MRQEPRDGINGLAAQVNAAHGRGVGHPIRHPARFNSCRHPSSVGVCDHGKKSVGEAQVYSASLPLISYPPARPPGAPGGVLLTREARCGAAWGDSLTVKSRRPPASLTPELPQDTSGHDSDVNKVRFPTALERSRNADDTFSEIFRHCLPLHKPSRESMRAVGERFHPAKRAVK